MSERKLSQWLRLKDNHPTMVKLMKLYDLAEELGISITFATHRVIIDDKERDASLPDLYLEDLEEGHDINTWPPSFEFKVITENPEYIAEQKKAWEERETQRKAEQARFEAERISAKKAEEERIAKETERAERKELVRLKEKYGE